MAQGADGSQPDRQEGTEDREAWAQVGLTAHEYEQLLKKLGRRPNPLELELVGAMWSEHCSYKSSRLHLETLPRSGPQVILGPGENAGVVDLGGPTAAALRCESHNHPSSIDPYRGAATGAGGILRDILAVGARPALVAGSLRAGPLADQANVDLLAGAAQGLKDFAAGAGVAAVNAEVFSGPGYKPAPLVNVLAVGFVPREAVFRGRAEGVGNPVFLVGAPTGAHGVRGASASSQELDSPRASEEELTANVPSADPELKRRIIEACLEMMADGLLVGVNDLGAAGLTSAASETAGRGGLGMDLNLDLVPCTEALEPYEIMLSETQERMLLIGTADSEAAVMPILKRWNLAGARIGTVADHGLLRLEAAGREVAALPAALLTEGAPLYDRPWAEPEDLEQRWLMPALTAAERGAAAPSDSAPRVVDGEEAHFWVDKLNTVLTSPNLGPARWLHRGDENDGSSLLASGVAVLPVPETKQKLVVALSGNGRLTWLDPKRGAAANVAAATRRVACAGGRPLGLTNCLNLGNPERREIMWEFKEIIAGLGETAGALQVPVTGGNVSFYNEREGQGVQPTPLVGVIGLLAGDYEPVSPLWRQAGDAILLLGPLAGSLGGSEYLAAVYGQEAGRPPAVNLPLEARLLQLLQALHEERLLSSAVDIGLGGLAVALAQTCQSEAVGATVDLPAGEEDLAPVLFGEGSGRVLVSTATGAVSLVMTMARALDVPVSLLGAVGGEEMTIRRGGQTVLKTAVAALPAPGEGTRLPWTP